MAAIELIQKAHVLKDCYYCCTQQHGSREDAEEGVGGCGYHSTEDLASLPIRV